MPSLADKAREAGTALTKQVLVSGHWRNQACGKRWQDHRRILIEPHVRNPDGEPSATTEHRLVTPTGLSSRQGDTDEPTGEA